jgi:hypothetical protein
MRPLGFLWRLRWFGFLGWFLGWFLGGWFVSGWFLAGLTVFTGHFGGHEIN